MHVRQPASRCTLARTSNTYNIRIHCHLIAGTQFFGQLYYVAYEWTYIDTHVNLCINFVEGFFRCCFRDYNVNKWIVVGLSVDRFVNSSTLFCCQFIGLLNYSVWRSVIFPLHFMFFCFLYFCSMDAFTIKLVQSLVICVWVCVYSTDSPCVIDFPFIIWVLLLEHNESMVWHSGQRWCCRKEW